MMQVLIDKQLAERVPSVSHAVPFCARNQQLLSCWVPLAPNSLTLQRPAKEGQPVSHVSGLTCVYVEGGGGGGIRHHLQIFRR